MGSEPGAASWREQTNQHPIGGDDRLLSLPSWFHREFDRGELLGSFADFTQERQPARVGMHVCELRVDSDDAEAGVVGGYGFLEPREDKIIFAAKGVNSGDVVGRTLLEFSNEGGQRGVGLGFSPESVIHEGKAVHPPQFRGLLLHLGERGVRFVFREQRQADCKVRHNAAGTYRERGTARGDRVIRSPSVNVAHAQVELDEGVQGVPGNGALSQRQRLVESAEALKETGAWQHQISVGGLQFERVFEMPSSLGEVIVSVQGEPGEHDVSPDIVRINGQCPVHGFLGETEIFSRCARNPSKSRRSFPFTFLKIPKAWLP